MDDHLEFVVEGKEDAQVTLQLEDDTDYEVDVDGFPADTVRTNLTGKLSLGLEFGEKDSVMVTIWRG
jgi:hypothetical protein